MRKKVTLITIIVLSIIVGKLLLKNILNNMYIKEFKNNSYSSIYLDLNSMVNIYEPYIVKYNYGNYYYKISKYDDAYNKYVDALKDSIPSNRICKVKINTSLSLVMQVDKKNNREEQNELLKKAKSYLDEDCGAIAPKEDQETAEALRKLIDELLNSEGSINNIINNDGGGSNSNDPLDDKIKIINQDNNNANNKRNNNMEENNNMDNREYCHTNCW